MNDLLQTHNLSGEQGIRHPIYNIFKPKRPNLTNLRLINTSSRVKLEGGKMYRRNDFTEKALWTAYANLGAGLIENHLNNEVENLEKFPIIQFPKFRQIKK